MVIWFIPSLLLSSFQQNPFGRFQRLPFALFSLFWIKKSGSDFRNKQSIKSDSPRSCLCCSAPSFLLPNAHKACHELYGYTQIEIVNDRHFNSEFPHFIIDKSFGVLTATVLSVPYVKFIILSFFLLARNFPLFHCIIRPMHRKRISVGAAASQTGQWPRAMGPHCFKVPQPTSYSARMQNSGRRPPYLWSFVEA